MSYDHMSKQDYLKELAVVFHAIGLALRDYQNGQTKCQEPLARAYVEKAFEEALFLEPERAVRATMMRDLESYLNLTPERLRTLADDYDALAESLPSDDILRGAFEMRLPEWFSKTA